MKKSQFIEVLNKIGSSINSGNKEYMVSYFNDAVETSCGLIIAYKYNLKKTFCFGYYDYNDSFENAENMRKLATSDENYFIEENTKKYDEILDTLKHDNVYWSSEFWNKPEIPIISISNERTEFDLSTNKKFANVKHGEFSKEDKELLIAFYTKLKEKQVKRCKTYLKKYGLSKIKAWTFDAMD